ncbi:GntR family transcriptional regulator [Faecalicatena acetigenes]|uniref:GntR family transcriptional regulator n=1 Tax=Faecalicatena acetigenes TaxID=2981790 RepID=A0ABT2TD82_9FIRM|nr:GntR family transcriptional regulator [Faecalicatena acetigenes]MCU6748207.1 GntR family transcriptional regulator [Faecalicatena acetigenes]SCI31792.1 Uncharacterized HTH-type transcriptional regulator ydfH [uncultured Clostridium sp.]
MIVKKRYGRETGREYVLRILKENIVLLELEPGSRISENDLAAELGISRTPVREALIELSKSKIVKIYPQKGSYVSLIDWAMVEEAQFMRITMEKAVIVLACQGIEEKKLSVLEKNVKLQQFYLDDNEPGELLELDNQFHKELFIMTNKPHIYKLMSNMMLHFERLRALRTKTVDQQYVIDDHMEILDAIRKKDVERGVSVMERHLTRHKIDEGIVEEKYRQYFEKE